MTTFAKVCLLTLAGLIAAGSASAQTITIFSDITHEDCVLAADNVGGYIYAYVFAMNMSNGVAAAQFSAPVPSCYPGGIYAGESAAPGVTIGNTQTGLTLVLNAPDCSGLPVLLTTIQVFVAALPPNTECCLFEVLPDPIAGSGQITIVNCNNQVETVFGGAVFVGDWYAPNYSNPYPAPGATDVPLNAQLDWDAVQCSCGLGIYYADVYFGTDPDPPKVVEFDQVALAGPYDPGPLQPDETYYWKLDLVDTDAGVRTTPVWSFTTTTALPVEETTWGRLKALMSE